MRWNFQLNHARDVLVYVPSGEFKTAILEFIDEIWVDFVPMTMPLIHVVLAIDFIGKTVFRLSELNINPKT